MKVSELIKELEGYKDFYGDNEIDFYNFDYGEEMTIKRFDSFKNKFEFHLNVKETD